MTDVYQERYMAHIARKRAIIGGTWARGQRTKTKESLDCVLLIDAIVERHSQRTFNDLGILEDDLDLLFEAVRLAPSSCNRQAIFVKVIEDDEQRLDLASLLVGGRGWLGRATTIFLLFADMRAYKSMVEREFMPWLDAGVVVQNVCLMAEALGIGSCFVNPNIREKDRGVFCEGYNPCGMRFCGAVALGNYDERDLALPKRKREEILYENV